jgi:putative ABC transport system permease protein
MFPERVFGDLGFAVRTFRRSPVLTCAVLLTLALGIGANTAIFTVIRGVLLKPLAYANPDRLVRLSVDNPRLNVRDAGFSEILFDELASAPRSFTETGAIFVGRDEMTLAGASEPEAIEAGRISADVLHILGVEPALGRALLPQDDMPGAPAVVLISYDLWRRHFSADPTIVGRSVNLNSAPATIVGVLPPGFAFPAPGLDAWVPQPAQYSGLPPQLRRSAGYLIGIARLRPGITIEQARAEMSVFSRQYAANHPGDSPPFVRVALLRDQLVASSRPLLWTLFGAVGFVLLIACANVASLLLARAALRSREFAVRAALGAPRRRIISQLLAESLLLSCGGGALGVLLARWAIAPVVHLDALHLPRTSEVHLDPLVLAFASAVSILAGVLFGLFPALSASRPDLMDALRTAGGATSLSAGGSRLISPRALLVTLQLALSTVLLIGTALLLESFARLSAIDPGFRPARLLTMQISLPPQRYGAQQQRAFFDDLVERVRSLPGVDSAAIARTLPMTAAISTSVAIEEQPPVDPKNRPPAQMQTVTPAYYETLGIPVRRGRAFDPEDRPDTVAPRILINERFAHLFWAAYPRGQDPIGQHVLIGNSKTGAEIIGIVGNTHDRALERESVPEFYLPLADNPVSAAGLLVRAKGDPQQLVKSIRAQVAALDRDQAISGVKTMEEMIADEFSPRRLTLILVAAFAGIALLLAVVGVFGIIAQSVAARSRELAIRSALGANARDIVRLVLREAILVTLAGLFLGVAGATALTRFMITLLFQVKPADPAIFAAVALLCAGISLCAAWIPARRAGRIDPLTALR